MQRPCFAVAILLASMAASLTLVSRVESQSRDRHVSGLPSPRAVCGFQSAGGRAIVLGQSGGAGDASGGPSRADRVAASRWFAIQGTGYDSSYDFAMHDGVYPGLARSTVDIEHSMAKVHEVELVAASDSELEEYFYQASTDRLPSWDSVATEALGLDARRWVSNLSQQARQWIAGELRHIGVWVETHDPVRPIASWSQSQLADIAWPSMPTRSEIPVAKVATVELLEFEWTDASGELELGVDYTDEVALITAADTLDMLSAQLEIAAERLRYWAAARMVEKSQARRLAHRPE